MKKLSEFDTQKHLTALLRAMVIKSDYSSSLIFIGGSHEERWNIAFSFMKAYWCDSPVNGDWCGECESCQKPFEPFKEIGGFPLEVQCVDKLEDAILPHKSYMEFELNPPVEALTPAYEAAAKQLARILRLDSKSVLEAATDYAKEYGYTPYVENLIFVLRDILALKAGAFTSEPSEAVRLLSTVMDQTDIIECLETLWKELATPVHLEDEIKTQVLSFFLKEILNATTDFRVMSNSNDKPIYKVEEQNGPALTFEEMAAGLVKT